MKQILMLMILCCAAALTAADFKSELDKANQLRKDKNFTAALTAFREAEKSASTPTERTQAIFGIGNCMHILNQHEGIPTEYKKIYDGEGFTDDQKNQAMRNTLRYISGKAKGELAERLVKSSGLNAGLCRDGRDAWAESLVSQNQFQQAVEVLKAKNDFPNYSRQWQIDTWEQVGKLYRDKIKDDKASLNAFQQAIAICQEIRNDPKFRADLKPEYRIRELSVLSEHPQLFPKYLSESLAEARKSENDNYLRVAAYRNLVKTHRQRNDQAECRSILEEAAEVKAFSNDDRAAFYMDLAGGNLRQSCQPLELTRAYIAKARALDGLGDKTKARLNLLEHQFQDND